MKPPIVMVLTMMLSACSSPLPVLEAGSRAADPNVPVKRVRYVPVTAGTRDYQPVEPKPWTEQRREAPKPEASQGSEQKSDEQSKSDAESTSPEEAQ
jgi:hypothetical protein